jgi:hypothetical protein
MKIVICGETNCELICELNYISTKQKVLKHIVG